jgi:hypothetical protein
MHIENIVIGMPLVIESKLLAYSLADWQQNEEKKTVYDEERFLPRLLVKYSFMKSTSEVKRNRPDLWVTLDKPDFLEIKIGKKKCWVVIGE